jgi:hypothetical protein
MLNLDSHFFPVFDRLDPATAYPGSYSLGLVVTSVAIAILAAFVALSISGRIAAATSPRHPVRPDQRQRGVVGGNGAADREGVWREDGNAPEHPGMARRLRYASTGRRDRGEALPAPCPRAALTGSQLTCAP